MSSPSWFSFRRSGFRIDLDYPIDARPRYGYGKPAHAILQQRLERNRDIYARRLSQFVNFAEHLARIPLVATEGSVSPCWKNGFLSGLDAVALYCLVALGNPRRYVEIGSGHSTRFVRQAIGDHGLRTAVTSIDPSPRAAVEPICDHRFNTGVEQAPVELFDELEAGDILFVDSSHPCLYEFRCDHGLPRYCAAAGAGRAGAVSRHFLAIGLSAGVEPAILFRAVFAGLLHSCRRRADGDRVAQCVYQRRRTVGGAVVAALGMAGACGLGTARMFFLDSDQVTRYPIFTSNCSQ